MFRVWTILVHRYLGIALSLLFEVWCLSGIAMIYTRGMPMLTPEERLRQMPRLDLGRIRLTPSQAAERARQPRVITDRGEVLLLPIMGRPAYRFPGDPPATVFADTGRLLEPIGEAESLIVASQFAAVPVSALRHVRRLDRADQWTIGLPPAALGHGRNPSLLGWRLFERSRRRHRSQARAAQRSPTFRGLHASSSRVTSTLTLSE